MSAAPRIGAMGERAILVTFGERIDPRSNARARGLADLWERAGIGPAVPAYASTLLHYDPLRLTLARAAALARSLASQPTRPRAAGRLVEIAVRYDGPDLAEVARLSSLDPREVVALHAAVEYRAYFVGFLPGFAYLGEVDERIRAPRLPGPRTRVPAGSVAIAGRQTAVYPFASPGGWRLIGSTDAPMFDPRRERAALVAEGDRVRFVPR
jgi:KipI family sensor histidine kinase inhibitor